MPENNYTIRIKSSSDTAAVDKAGGALDRFAKTADNARLRLKKLGTEFLRGSVWGTGRFDRVVFTGEGAGAIPSSTISRRMR